MRYFVTVEGRTFEVEVEGGIVRVDGAVVDADLAGGAGEALRHLLLDGRGQTLIVRGGDNRGEWEIQTGDRMLHLEAVDERTRAIRAMTGAGAGPRGPAAVRAPMPGLIVRIEVEAGQSVRAGQGVVVMEAMKMENELKADGPGTVARILVAAGQAVEKGAILVEFEAPDD